MFPHLIVSPWHRLSLRKEVLLHCCLKELHSHYTLTPAPCTSLLQHRHTCSTDLAENHRMTASEFIHLRGWLSRLPTFKIPSWSPPTPHFMLHFGDWDVCHPFFVSTAIDFFPSLLLWHDWNTYCTFPTWCFSSLTDLIYIVCLSGQVMRQSVDIQFWSTWKFWVKFFIACNQTTIS